MSKIGRAESMYLQITQGQGNNLSRNHHYGCINIQYKLYWNIVNVVVNVMLYSYSSLLTESKLLLSVCVD